MISGVARAGWRATAAAAFAVTIAGAARASIVAPPTPEEVEALFADACWRGLRDPRAFREAVESSTLRLRRIEDVTPAHHYGGRASAVYYFPGARCTIRASLRSLDAADDILRRVSRLTPLEAARVGDAQGATRSFRSPEQPVRGGRVGVELTYTPPPPRPGRYRPMYPPAFELSISAYFVADE